MRLRVLGCSGGIAAQHGTTSLLLDDDLLIDCGTGVGDLTIDEMARLRHVFLTHSHLDHTSCLPLLVDTIFDRLDEPLTVHGLPETLNALRHHVFNDVMWPDFARLPNAERPVLRYAEIRPEETRTVGDRWLTPIRVNHAVPAVGYHVASSGGAFAFSGDTTTNDNLWRTLNGLNPVDLLIVECAFADADRQLSIDSRHYCPELLAADLVKLRRRPPIYLTHPKPGEESTIFGECRRRLPEFDLQRLCGGDTFDL